MKLSKTLSNEDRKFNQVGDVLLRLNSTAMFESKEVVDNYKVNFNLLIGMGFSPRIINNCFRLYRFTTLPEAIELLIKGDDDRYVHKFLVKDPLTSVICDICEEPIERHAEFAEKENLKKSLSKPIGASNVWFRDTLKKMASTDLVKKASEKPIIPIDQSGAVDNRTCDICMGDFDFSGLHAKFKLSCKHFFCESCLLDHIKTEIINGRILKISCPQAGCNMEIVPDHLKDLLSNEPGLFQKYEKFKVRKRLEENENNIFCPETDCEGNVILENLKNQPQTNITCQFGHHICSRCGKKWHEDICEKVLDNEVEQLVLEGKLLYKRCPKCEYWIDKNEGCNHMTCRECKYEWCWLCNGKYTENHFQIQGTPCYDLKFQPLYVRHSKELYERAKKEANGETVPPVTSLVFINNPNPPNGHVALPVVANYQPRPRREWSYCNYMREFSGMQVIKDAPNRCCDSCGYLCGDFLCFIVLSVFNFLGNPAILIYLWHNEELIELNNHPCERRKIVKFLYYFSMIVLYLLYFITILGTSLAVFTINCANSCIHNRFRCNYDD